MSLAAAHYERRQVVLGKQGAQVFAKVEHAPSVSGGQPAHGVY
jgi:hypothetical protein